jgi:hypothetical protein
MSRGTCDRWRRRCGRPRSTSMAARCRRLRWEGVAYRLGRRVLTSELPYASWLPRTTNGVKHARTVLRNDQSAGAQVSDVASGDDDTVQSLPQRQAARNNSRCRSRA